MEHLVLDIFHLLAHYGENLSVAESCTGGGLSNTITTLSGISPVFLGGVTAYANSSKEHILRIPKELIDKHGAVSSEVAVAMASNCREVFGSTWAISTTGIAGPTGGSKEKPVGLVYIGIANEKSAVAHRCMFSNSSRIAHREHSIAEALSLLKIALKAGRSIKLNRT